MDWLKILFCDLIAFIAWLIFVFIIFFGIYSKPEKHRKDYPFFSECWIKKIFFIGLNGEIKPSIVIFTFFVNLSLCLLVPWGIWWSVSPTSVVAEYGYCIIFGIYFACYMVRLILTYKNPPCTQIGIERGKTKDVDLGASIFSDNHGELMGNGMKISYIIFGNPIYWIWDLIANGGYGPWEKEQSYFLSLLLYAALY